MIEINEMQMALRIIINNGAKLALKHAHRKLADASGCRDREERKRINNEVKDLLSLANKLDNTDNVLFLTQLNELFSINVTQHELNDAYNELYII